MASGRLPNSGCHRGGPDRERSLSPARPSDFRHPARPKRPPPSRRVPDKPRIAEAVGGSVFPAVTSLNPHRRLPRPVLGA